MDDPELRANSLLRIQRLSLVQLVIGCLIVLAVLVTSSRGIPSAVLFFLTGGVGMLVQATERFRWIGFFLNLFLGSLMALALVLAIRESTSILAYVLLPLGVILCGINGWTMARLGRETGPA